MTEMERFAAEHAPCYIYDKRTITKACRELRAAMPGVGFLYSIKSNPFAPVIRTAAGEGCGADAASSAEVLAALDAGIRPEDVFYSSPGKTDRDIAVAAGKCVVTADSLHELDRLNAHAAGTGRTLAVGLRVNPAFGMGGGAAGPSKFGVDEEQLPALFARVRDMQHVTVRGIHVHLRSQVLNAAALSGYYANCFALAERTAAEFGVRMDFINFGGGMGTVYDTVRDSPLDLAALSRTMADIGQRNRQGLGARLYMETGRYLTCRAGLFCTRAVDVKESRGTRYVIVESGLNGFLRPAVADLVERSGQAEGLEPLYTQKNAFAVRNLTSGEREMELVTVVGSLCTPLDVMARDIMLPRTRPGDTLAVSNAGSYGRSLSPLGFSSHEPPREFLWEEAPND